jgi:hypothetical protein
MFFFAVRCLSHLFCFENEVCVLYFLHILLGYAYLMSPQFNCFDGRIGSNRLDLYCLVLSFSNVNKYLISGRLYYYTGGLGSLASKNLIIIFNQNKYSYMVMIIYVVSDGAIFLFYAVYFCPIFTLLIQHDTVSLLLNS